MQQWNSNYSTSPVIGSDINVGSLNNTRTIEYLGNMVYETLNTGAPVRKQVLIDGGYVDENNIYHYYFRDHLGNNRVITDQTGTVKQQNHYYPFGITFAETPNAEQGMQPYKYNDKELDRFNGLNWYDYMARYMDSAVGRFTIMDPLAEKYFSWSPYVYCGNNPMKYIDPTGMDIWIYYEQDGVQKKLLYSQDMNYNGNNAFVSQTIYYLNAMYSNGGDKVLNELISSANNFNFKNITPSVKGEDVSEGVFQFNENPNGGGDILAGSLMSNTVSGFNKLKVFLMRCFMGFSMKKIKEEHPYSMRLKQEYIL